MFLSLEQWGKTERKDQRFSDITRAFQHLSAVAAYILSFCDAVGVATNACCGAIAGSDALSAYGRIL